MVESKFKYDQKRAARVVEKKFVEEGHRREDALREAVDRVAGSEPLGYRKDLFTVLRETWHNYAN